MALLDDSYLWEDIDDNIFVNSNDDIHDCDEKASTQKRSLCESNDKKQCSPEKKRKLENTEISQHSNENNDATLSKCTDKSASTSSHDCKNRKPESIHSTRTENDAKDGDISPVTTPLQRFRRGYLWVSDLLSQSWCEQQMVYGFTLPTIAVENPVVKAGSDIHLARELEVQDVVEVKVTSSEDIFAVKVLNICKAADHFLHGLPVCREIPIFGAPFEDVFLMGMIDEIRCDQDNFTLDLLEFKTRRFKSLPAKAQALTHELQVMIYKTLFDNLVSGKTSKEVLVKHLHLDLSKSLGEDIMKHINNAGLKECTMLDKLLDVLYERMGLLPHIGQMLVEYCYQEDRSTIGVKQVVEDTKLLHEKVFHYIKYWKGKREPCGVDIEDAWKCQRCDFADVCEWRERKAEEYARRNTKKHS